MVKYQLKTKPIEAVTFMGMHENGEPCFDGSGDWLDEALQTERLIKHPMWPETRLQLTMFPAEVTAPPITAIVDAGDYIICGENGKLNVVKPETFEQAYDLVED